MVRVESASQCGAFTGFGFALKPVFWTLEPYLTHLVRTSPRFLKITVLSKVPVPYRFFNFLEGGHF